MSSDLLSDAYNQTVGLLATVGSGEIWAYVVRKTSYQSELADERADDNCHGQWEKC